MYSFRFFFIIGYYKIFNIVPCAIQQILLFILCTLMCSICLIYPSPYSFPFGNHNPICKTEKETQMYRTDFWTLWEKARVGCFKRTASKHVYYLGWNRSPAQVGCMRQVLGAGALGWPRGMGWGGRWEGGPGWGTHVDPWLIHVNVWQKSLQYCKVISLQLIKINEGKNKIK